MRSLHGALRMAENILGNWMGIGKLAMSARTSVRDYHYRCSLPRVKKVGRHQIAMLVVCIHEAVRYVDQNGEEGGEDHHLACYLLPAVSGWFASRHAARIGPR